MKFISLLIFTSILFFLGCTQGKVIKNASTFVVPLWVEDSRQYWKEGDLHLYKISATLRGTGSPSACFQIALLDLEESIIKEITVSLYPLLQKASLALNEDIDFFIALLASIDIENIVYGLGIKHKYWEQYTTEYGGLTSLRCYSIGEINTQNYQMTKNTIISLLIQKDPRLQKFLITST